MRKATRRTVWVPVLDPMEHAKWQASKLSPAEWNEQVIPVQVALDQLLIGNWNKLEGWNPIFHALNRIESMLKLFHRPDYGFVEQMQGVISAALDREEKTGAKAFKHDEIAALRELVSTYGDLLREVSHRQFKMTCAHTDANVARILKAKKGIQKKAHCLMESA